MQEQSYIDWINILILALNAFVIYRALIHDKRKDFESKLFELKLEAYRSIHVACSEIQLQLDINSDPFVKIYDYDKSQKGEWEDYCRENILPMVNVGQGCFDSVFKEHGVYIPNSVMDCLQEFCVLATRYIVESVHFDTRILLDKEDRLNEALFNLRQTMRTDLGIDKLDRSLEDRINAKIA
ncbi:MAG: hypothetical protein R2813_00835 [Flavobacteriales bacterium]